DAEDAEDNITTVKSDIFWLLDGLIACAEIFFVLRYLKARISLNLTFSSIYKGALSFILWILSALTISTLAIRAKNDDLYEVSDITTVAVMILNLSRQYVADLRDIYWLLGVFKIGFILFELFGIIPEILRFSILITICEGVLLYNNSGPTL
ncbi:16579_t:CDS:2, partial [Racocetra fulgida]